MDGSVTNNIVPQQIRFKARCLVLTYADDFDSSMESKAQQTILNGMVGVLELSAIEIMHASIDYNSHDLNAIIAKIQEWQPQTILQLSMEFPILNINIPCIQTYSPKYLLHNKQFKPKAYKDLLNLRAILHGTS